MMVSLLTHICVTRPQWVNPATKPSRKPTKLHIYNLDQNVMLITDKTIIFRLDKIKSISRIYCYRYHELIWLRDMRFCIYSTLFHKTFWDSHLHNYGYIMQSVKHRASAGQYQLRKPILRSILFHKVMYIYIYIYRHWWLVECSTYGRLSLWSLREWGYSWLNSYPSVNIWTTIS